MAIYSNKLAFAQACNRYREFNLKMNIEELKQKNITFNGERNSSPVRKASFI